MQFPLCVSQRACLIRRVRRHICARRTRIHGGDTRLLTSSALREEDVAARSHDSDHAAVVRNDVGVQLLSPQMHAQVFGNGSFPPLNPRALDISKQHLSANGLAKKDSPVIRATDFKLPQLQGANIEEHFHSIGLETSAPYLELSQKFADAALPPKPESWQQASGWTRYHADGSCEPVDFPADEALVFDVEVLYKISPYAVMAMAASKASWYSWVSPWLLGETNDPAQLVSLPGHDPTVLVGHNIGYDRARISEEYNVGRTQNRFLDTMSLHMAITGLTSHQRAPWMLHRKRKQQALDEGSSEIEATAAMGKRWEDLSAMNSLADVAKLHCNIDVDKSARDWFGTDDKNAILDQFQDLMTYCAHDVEVTHKVYSTVFPAFLKACPNPVTFAGVLHMGNSFLPVDQSWSKFIADAENLYQSLTSQVETELHRLADKARRLMFEKSKADPSKMLFEVDPWLSQLDWTPKKARSLSYLPPQEDDVVPSTESATEESIDHAESTIIASGVEGSPSSVDMSSDDSHASHFPAWYTACCPGDDEHITSHGWDRTVPLLLQMSWDNRPLQYSDANGWYYSIPTAELPETEPPHRITDAQAMSDDVAHFQPQATVTRRLFNSRFGYFMQTGMVSSSDLTTAKRLCDLNISAKLSSARRSTDFAELEDKLRQRAKAAVNMSAQDASNDAWLSQLDWAPAPNSAPAEHSRVEIKAEDPPPVRKSKHRTQAKEPSVAPTDAVWPKWYWEMAKPRDGEEGLNLSIRSKAAPLLLQLRWDGWPLFHSRQHGWMYRIPKAKVPDIDPAQEEAVLLPLQFSHKADDRYAEDPENVYYKLPHKDGAEANVGTPLSKTFIPAFEAGILSSDFPAASAALDMNAQCSYWISARERILNQMVVWQNGEQQSGFPVDSASGPHGMILPQVVTMGTVTRRAVESTWLAASNAKKNRLGSELKAMVRAPPGYAIVGADVDSEELWICCVMGDAQFGLHGATAIGWMTLEGTKSAGTDLHSKTASILGISRDKAKVFNYSRIYGAGVKHALQLLLQANPKLSKKEAKGQVDQLYAATKGLRDFKHREFFGRSNKKFWHGGTESHVFNTLEEIAMAHDPRTPALGCGVTSALARANLPKTEKAEAGEDFMPSRINWVVQSSGVDYLHMLIASMEYLLRRFNIDARFMISVHDEIRYLVREEDKYRAALALQISNLWTRALFSYRLQMESLPQSCAWFSAVDIDHVLRKEVNMDCVTPSQPVPIPHGESQDIETTLKYTSQGSLFADGRSMTAESELGNAARRSDSPAAPKAIEYRARDTSFLEAQCTRSKKELDALVSRLRRQADDDVYDVARYPAGWQPPVESSSVKTRQSRPKRTPATDPTLYTSSHGKLKGDGKVPVDSLRMRRAPANHRSHAAA